MSRYIVKYINLEKSKRTIFYFETEEARDKLRRCRSSLGSKLVVISRGWGESKMDKTGGKAAWKQSGKRREREDCDGGINKK